MPEVTGYLQPKGTGAPRRRPQEGDDVKRHHRRAQEDGLGYSPRSPGTVKGPQQNPQEGSDTRVINMCI